MQASKQTTTPLSLHLILVIKVILITTGISHSRIHIYFSRRFKVSIVIDFKVRHRVGKAVLMISNLVELWFYGLGNLFTFWVWLREGHMEWPLFPWPYWLHKGCLLVYVIVNALMEHMIQAETIIGCSIFGMMGWSWPFSSTKMWEGCIIHYLHEIFMSTISINS